MTKTGHAAGLSGSLPLGYVIIFLDYPIFMELVVHERSRLISEDRDDDIFRTTSQVVGWFCVAGYKMFLLD